MYKTVIKNKGNATTPFSASEQTITVSPGTSRIYNAYKKIWVADSYMTMLPAVVPTINISQDMQKLALARATADAYDKIREYQTPFEGQVFAGEIREVIALLRNPFATAAKLTQDLVKKRGMKKFAKNAGDLWLEYRFGVLPLIADINSILELAAGVAEQQKHDSFKAFGQSTETSNVMSSASSTGTTWHKEIITKLQAQHYIRCGVIFELLEKHETFAGRISDSFDDLSSIAVSAWEFIPFSFLADYFVNINDLIVAGVTPRSSVSYTSSSAVLTREVTQIVRGLTPGGDYRWQKQELIEPRKTVSRIRTVSRTNALLAIPPITFTLPGSNIRYANIAALLTNLL